MTCSFVKFGCSIGIFLNTAHLICRSTDISKYFRGSFRLRDNESRLYIRTDRFRLEAESDRPLSLFHQSVHARPIMLYFLRKIKVNK